MLTRPTAWAGVQYFRNVTTRSTAVLRSSIVMTRRGLIDPMRPWDGLRALRISRRAGPFAAMLDRPVRRYPNRIAVIDDRGATSFGELDDLANGLANALTEIGIESGSVLGIVCRDHREVVLTAVACGRRGVRVVFMNTGMAATQMADVARREGITAVMVDPALLHLTAGIPVLVRRILARPSGLDRSVSDGVVSIDMNECPHVDVDSLIARSSRTQGPLPEAPGGLVLLTSGTTGTPKGARRQRISPFQSAQFLDRVPLASGGVMVIAAPLFHGTGLSQFIVAMALGKTVVLRPQKFDAEATVRELARHRADALVVVPTMLSRILDLGEKLSEYDLSSLQIISCGGSALSPNLCRRTEEVFGPVLYNLYGSTEVAQATVATPRDLLTAPGCAGRAPVGCRVAIYDDRYRRITEPGVRGDIYVSSGLSFSGYTDGSSKALVDGLFSTGDRGYLNSDGLLYVEGRADDMVVSGGENVYPLEIENLLAARADITDVAVVGVDDPDFGQRLRAYVVVSGEKPPTPEDLKQHARSSLARYKVPRDVVFVDRIPRNSMGKIVRSELLRHDLCPTGEVGNEDR